jgi:hypothetical protein
MEKNKEFISNEGTVASPELAQQFQDIIDYIEKTPFSKIFPKKHKALIKVSAKRKTYELFEKSPEMPLKNVVTTVLADLFDDTLSAELILKTTELIIQNWEHLSATVYENKVVEELV